MGAITLRIAWVYLVLVCFAMAAGSKELFAQPLSTPKVWNGEIIESDQGLVTLYAEMIDARVKNRSGPFSFLLRGKTTKLTYNFSAATQEPKLPPTQYWKIKADVYEILEVNFVDEKGRARKWKGPYPRTLTVTSRSLASLGNWYMVTLKDDQVKILLKPVHIKLPLDKWKGSVQSITNAFTGSVLSRYKPIAADKNKDFRRVFRSTRSIQMVYKLDLFRMNSHAAEMAKVLQANDADIRSCYTDLIDKQSDAKGNLIYSFVYSGINQGIKSMKVKSTGPKLKDTEFSECLYFKLRGLTFPLRQSLAGELSFQFNIVE